MIEASAELLAEHARLERELADPAMHADQNRARIVGKRYAELTPVVETQRELAELDGDLRTARELAAEDESFRAEIPVLEARRRVPVSRRPGQRPASRPRSAPAAPADSGEFLQNQGGIY